jgi:hypothetical protein
MHLGVFDWGLANPGPHRREPRIGALAGAKGLPGSGFAPPEYPYTRSFSNRMPVLSSLSGHEVNDIAQAAVRPHGCLRGPRSQVRILSGAPARVPKQPPCRMKLDTPFAGRSV